MAKPLNPPPSQTPPPGDQANAVVQGVLAAVGPSAPISTYGATNVFIWGSVTTTLATTAASSSATVGSATNVAAGQTINSPNLPAGTTVGAISGTTVTLAFPPGHTNAEVVAGTDAAAVFMSAAITATVQLERSFDGGSTWLVCGVGGSGAQAVYANPSCISVTLGECEKQMGYRLNCTAFTASGPTINYRLSATGHMATSAGSLTV